MNHRSRGFTLIELMLGLLLGLIVLGGVLGVFVTTYQSSSQDIKRVRLNEEMRAVMEMMSGDLRRAGSWQRTATEWSATMSNPFTNGTNWTLGKYSAGSPDASCALFAYGTGTIQNAERFGYRLRPVGVGIPAPRVETYHHTATAGDWTCGGARWQPISDQSVVAITDLDFVATLEPSAPGVQLRTVVVTLRAATNTRGADPTKNAAGATLSAADCPDDASPNVDIVCRRMVQTVRVRNDVPPPPP